MIFSAECLSLYLVTDRSMIRGDTLPRLVEKAVDGGVTAVQIREKEAGGAEFLEVACQVKQVLAGSCVPLIINDRVDVALAVAADGIHVGQSDLPVDMVRKLVGSGMFVGLSVSSPQQALLGESQGADYLGAGPVFATRTKLDTDPVLDIARIKAITRAVGIPVVAIGGIHAGNVSGLSGTGLAGVAVVSAICAAEDPKSAAEELAACVSAWQPDLEE